MSISQRPNDDSLELHYLIEQQTLLPNSNVAFSLARKNFKYKKYEKRMQLKVRHFR